MELSQFSVRDYMLSVAVCVNLDRLFDHLDKLAASLAVDCDSPAHWNEVLTDCDSITLRVQFFLDRFVGLSILLRTAKLAHMHLQKLFAAAIAEAAPPTLANSGAPHALTTQVERLSARFSNFRRAVCAIRDGRLLASAMRIVYFALRTQSPFQTQDALLWIIGERTGLKFQHDRAGAVETDESRFGFFDTHLNLRYRYSQCIKEWLQGDPSTDAGVALTELAIPRCNNKNALVPAAPEPQQQQQQLNETVLQQYVNTLLNTTSGSYRMILEGWEAQGYEYYKEQVEAVRKFVDMRGGRGRRVLEDWVAYMEKKMSNPIRQQPIISSRMSELVTAAETEMDNLRPLSVPTCGSISVRSNESFRSAEESSDSTTAPATPEITTSKTPMKKRKLVFVEYEHPPVTSASKRQKTDL